MPKPSTAEEEFFQRQEIEKLRKAREEEARRLSEEQRRKARELHFMKCPKCGMDLQEITYHQVTLDKCFSCGGLWFDEGEIDHVKAAEAGGFLTSLRAIFKK
jgi:hypothetical protein